MPITYSRGDIVSQTTITPPTNPRGQIAELLIQAKAAKSKLGEFARRISQSIDNSAGKPIGFKTESVDNKDASRVAEKCGINLGSPASNSDRSGPKEPVQIKDIARASIVCSTEAQLFAIRDFIFEQPEFTVIADKKDAVKDLWSNKAGKKEIWEQKYKDVKFYLQVKVDFELTESTKDGKKIKRKYCNIPHIVELQLLLRQMDRGKTFGHAFYNLSRLAILDGVQGPTSFEPTNAKCKIVVPANKKGKIGNKLRKALVECRQLAATNKKEKEELTLAIGILTKMLNKNFTTAQDAKKAADSDGKAQGSPAATNKDIYDFVDDGKPLVIQCGQIGDGKLKPAVAAEKNQSTSQAQAWAINRLSQFVWAHYTKCQSNPGITGSSNSMHAA